MSIGTWVGQLRPFMGVLKPRMFMPHAAVHPFSGLPLPLSKLAVKQKLDIRSVVLDLDDTFALPHTNQIFPAYKVP